jgi:hypothetical protein
MSVKKGLKLMAVIFENLNKADPILNLHSFDVEILGNSHWLVIQHQL